MALAAQGDEPGAIAVLTSALDLGCPQGYVRVFADEGPAMAAVLGRLIAAQRSDQRAARIPLTCLARLQRAFGDGHPAGGPAGGRAATDARASRLIDQLTSRELEVLAMLAAGRSNQAIARQLVISLDTVKKHVSHLMGKLGAANRTEAVARGRELGLIDEACLRPSPVVNHGSSGPMSRHSAARFGDRMGRGRGLLGNRWRCRSGGWCEPCRGHVRHDDCDDGQRRDLQAVR
jgi:DNA-binding CsgD family transcriptional regulator